MEVSGFLPGSRDILTTHFIVSGQTAEISLDACRGVWYDFPGDLLPQFSRARVGNDKITWPGIQNQVLLSDALFRRV
jgi:hypothetical protein